MPSACGSSPAIPTSPCRGGWRRRIFSIWPSGRTLLSIHVSFAADTCKLIDETVLRNVKSGCLVVNTARGEVLDEGALLAGLSSGRIGGAALDVLRFENAGGQAADDARALIVYAKAHENLLLTPHIGGATAESMEKTEIFIAEKIRAFLREAGIA